MLLLFPVILVALGGAVLLVLRGRYASVFALASQWAGLTAALAQLGPRAGFGVEAASEGLTALVCCALMLITLRRLVPGRAASPGGDPRRLSIRHISPGEYLLPSAVVLVGGVAGVGFARLFPVTAEPLSDIVLYWTGLGSGLALVLYASRDPVKLLAGLLGLFNAAAFIASAAPRELANPALLGALSLSRIALTLGMTYIWTLLVSHFHELDLAPVFNSRDFGAVRALVAVDGPAEVAGTGEQAAEPPVEASEPDTSMGHGDKDEEAGQEAGEGSIEAHTAGDGQAAPSPAGHVQDGTSEGGIERGAPAGTLGERN